MKQFMFLASISCSLFSMEDPTVFIQKKEPISHEEHLCKAMNELYAYAISHSGQKKLFQRNPYRINQADGTLTFTSIQAIQNLDLSKTKKEQLQEENDLNKAVLIAQELLFHILIPECFQAEVLKDNAKLFKIMRYDYGQQFQKKQLEMLWKSINYCINTLFELD